jgi:hypothetical protein
MAKRFGNTTENNETQAYSGLCFVLLIQLKDRFECHCYAFQGRSNYYYSKKNWLIPKPRIYLLWRGSHNGSFLPEAVGLTAAFSNSLSQENHAM